MRSSLVGLKGGGLLSPTDIPTSSRLLSEATLSGNPPSKRGPGGKYQRRKSGKTERPRGIKRQDFIGLPTPPSSLAGMKGHRSRSLDSLVSASDNLSLEKEQERSGERDSDQSRGETQLSEDSE